MLGKARLGLEVQSEFRAAFRILHSAAAALCLCGDAHPPLWYPLDWLVLPMPHGIWEPREVQGIKRASNPTMERGFTFRKQKLVHCTNNKIVSQDDNQSTAPASNKVT